MTKIGIFQLIMIITINDEMSVSAIELGSNTQRSFLSYALTRTYTCKTVSKLYPRT